MNTLVWILEPAFRLLSRWMFASGMALQCSDAPDTSGMNAAAKANAELGNKAFDWYSAEYERTRPDRERAAAEASQVTQAQLAAMNQQNELAKDYADYNRGTFRPLEQRIVADSQTFDTPERRQAASDAAVADVNQAVAQQREARMADLASYGIAPDTARSQSMAASGEINASKAVASAAKAARDKVEATGWARMADAANLGRNLASSQATAIQTGTNAGNSALNATNAGLNATYSGSNLMNTGFQTAMNGNQSAGNLYGQVAQLNSGGSNLGASMAGVGGLMQGVGALFSSKKLKHKGADVDGREALDAIVSLDDDSWRYKPGVEDEGTHVGPYAEDVQRKFGDAVAPGGVVVNMAELAKKNKSAISELAAELAGLETQLAKLERRA